MPQIEVTFDIDANGIVNVSAKDTATGKEQRITITASSGLSERDIDRMVKEAEQHSAEDEKRRRDIEIKNQAEQLLYATEKTLEEHRNSLPAAEVSTADSAMGELKAALETGDTARIEAAKESVTQIAHKIAELVYQKNNAANAARPGPDAAAGQWGQKPEDADVIDAEFEETGS
jgi:molecular chaperone DnaK